MYQVPFEGRNTATSESLSPSKSPPAGRLPTNRTNDMLVVRIPSLAVSVIVVTLVRLAAGVMVKVREAPDPLSTRFAFGTSVVFDELADTLTAAAPLSTSPTVKFTTSGVLTGVVRLGTLEI